MNDSTQHSKTDLKALLEELPPEEAERLREVWEMTSETEPTGDQASIDTEDALRDVLEAIKAREEDTSSVPDPQKRSDRAPRARQHASSRRERWLPIASALVLLLAVGGLWYWWSLPITQTAPRGEQVSATLPDGSQVELNSGSSIRYEPTFGAVRAVRLKGEAFFEVAKGPRPFVVHTFNADVRVFGTSFNVEAWPDAPGPSTRVTLVDGQVELSASAHPDHKVRLAPGETRQVRAGQSSSIAPLELSVDDATAWRRGDLIVKDRPLGEVLNEVERRFTVDLTVHPASLRRQRISLALRTPKNGEAIVRDLARALGLRYRETSNGFELYK